MTTPRPKTLTPEMALAAARIVVDDLARQRLVEAGDVESCVKDVAKHARLYADGYEIAKTLDDRCHWDCNLEMAEVLDGFSVVARHQIETAEKTRAAHEGIVPALQIGTRVKINTGERGEITEVAKHGVAKYLVKIDGDKEAAPPSNARRVVNFEDAQPIPP